MNEGRAAEFLAGERLDDVAIYLPEGSVSDPSTLLEGPYAEATGSGVVIVVDGERGRSVFEQISGIDPMRFAGSAMQTPGMIDRDLTDGNCHNAIEGPGDHRLQFALAFAEGKNEEVGGIYAEGDVIHAYAQCSCGETFGEKWAVGAE